MPYLNDFCCNCQLRTGTKIVACIESFFNLVAVGFISLGLANDEGLKRVIENRFKDLDDLDDFDDIVNNEHVKAKISAIVYLTIKVVMILPSIVLWSGAVRRNRILLLPYLITAAINLIYDVIWIILRLMFMGHSPENNFVVLVSFSMTALFTYFWTCVFSFYQQLRDQENRPHRPILLEPNPINTMYFQPPPSYEKYLASPGAVIYSNQPINTITQSTPMGYQPVSMVYPGGTYPTYPPQYPMQMMKMPKPPPYSSTENVNSVPHEFQSENVQSTPAPSAPQPNQSP